MQIKQFNGETAEEVLDRIRQEMGEDAVILQTRRVVRGGIGGFFGKQGIEVTAADGLAAGEADAAAANLDAADAAADGEHADGESEPFARHLTGRLAAAVEAEEMAPPQDAGPPAAPASAYARAGVGDGDDPGSAPGGTFAPGDAERTQAIVQAAREALQEAHRRSAEQAATMPAAVEPAPAERVATSVAPPAFIPAAVAAAPPVLPVPEAPPAPEPADEVAPPFVAGLAEAAPMSTPAPAPPAPPTPVEAVVLVEAPPEPGPGVAAAEPEPVAERLLPAAAELPAPAGLCAARDELLVAGVDPRYLGPLLDGFERHALPFVEGGTATRDDLRRWIATHAPVLRDHKPRSGGSVVVMVGQRGTGKTTTTAKLAGRLAGAGQDVALIGAGTGQHPTLVAFARELGLPLALAPNAAALEAACVELGGRDAVIVDTPGSSAQDLAEVEALAALLAPVGAHEVHLVLPVSTALNDLGDVARRFRMVGVNRVTLTRLDETRFCGNVLNVPLRLGKPLAYLADGPAVPGALHPVDAGAVTELLLP